MEDLSQRTDRIRVLVNPDWTVDQETYAAARWVKRDDGRWVGVDYNLVALPGGGFSPTASPASVVIDGGGAREFARLDLPGGGTTIWSWPEALPTPAVDGPTATYAVAEGVDLVVTATASGVSTRIRINFPEALAPEFTDRVECSLFTGEAVQFSSGVDSRFVLSPLVLVAVALLGLANCVRPAARAGRRR